MPDDGIVASLDEALSLAEAELTAGTVDAADVAVPTGDAPAAEADAAALLEQAESPSGDVNEQPATGDSEVAALLDDLPEPAEATAIEDTTTFDITTPEGVEAVTLADLKAGFLRQSDYTRKTQELSAQRALLQEAVDFHKAFVDDPQGAALYLAQRAKIVDGNAAAPEGVTIYTEQDVQRMVEERLATALAEDPRIKEAETATAIQRVNAAFSEIEREYSVSLTEDHRRSILMEARDRGVNDLSLVFAGMLEKARRTRADKARVNAASPSQPKAGTPEEPADTTTEVRSMRDAFEAALNDLGGGI